MERRNLHGGPALLGNGGDPLELVRRRLLRQAFVFEDPAAYAAGVEDALAAVAELSVHDGSDPSPVEAVGAHGPRLIAGGAAR